MKQTVTNAERKEFFNNLIANIDNEIRRCNLNIEAPMIIKCNCIVATEDGEYQIGVDENKHANVLVGNFSNPVWMTREGAENLLYEQEFKASNGFGELKFKIWGWKSFFAQRKANLEAAREAVVSTMTGVVA